MIVVDCYQNTDEWIAIRSSLPTASNASKLITSTGTPSKSLSAFAQQLAGNKYSGRELSAWEGNHFTDRGHEVEATARVAYEFQNDVTVDEVGFITDDLGLYGCSPDGLVGEDGMVEIKCLPVKHISALLYYKKHEKPPTDYIAQVQFQLLVTGRKYCDLFYYHDNLPNLTIRIEPDKGFQEVLSKQILICIAERDSILQVLNEF